MIRIFITLVALVLGLAARSEAIPLKVGDILLQPLHCKLCNLIEEEEDTIYSHIGIVLSVDPVVVAEAFGKVSAVDLSVFNKKTEKGLRVKVLRFRNEKISEDLFKERQKNLTIFKNDFDGREYDPQFLWNNMNQFYEEKYYCSELVSKLLKAFAGIDTPIKKMHFNKNREQWNVHFKGNIPDGKPGNSPADFDRSELFYSPGEL